ncbi:hypothetical protein IG631_10873 [Alternaria alternata]|nr:hypothetical protein IG631_10873 [Alternaria alternata]
MKKLIRKHDKMLQRIANDTQRMREAHSIEATESILGTDDSSSVFSQLQIRTKISDHHSGSLFESDLLKSDVYSKALNNTMKQTADIEPNDANTVADDGMTMYNDDSDRTIDSPITKEDPTSALMAGTPRFAPLRASFTSAFSYLRVGTIGACSLENYTAQSPEELSLKRDDDIVALRKLDEWRYSGEIYENDIQRTGIVDRRKLNVEYHLNVPLQIKASRDSKGDADLEGDRYYRKGDALEIEASAINLRNCNNSDDDSPFIMIKLGGRHQARYDQKTLG